MVNRIVLAIVVAVATTLACALVGLLLVQTATTTLHTLGAFLEQYGFTLGILAGLWYFFSHRTTTTL